MRKIKDMTIKVRLSNELSVAFDKVCQAEEQNVSSILRKLIEDYITNHVVTKRNLEVIVDIGKLHGRGISEKDEYEVSAKLTGNISDIGIDKIQFLLPEFIFDGREQYLIDSSHEYRDIFPNCRNGKARLLGAKLINNEWKGAIFIYDTKFISNPNECFERVKYELKTKIIAAVNQKISTGI